MKVVSKLEEALEHHKAGRLHEAEILYRAILSQEPNHADALHWSGVLAHQLGRQAKAVALIQRALALNPNDAAAYNNLGLALEAQGKVEEAVDAFRSALALAPDDSEIHKSLGVALKEQGRTAEAIDVFARAATLSPDDSDALNSLAIALRAQGKLEEAISAYRRALAISPDFAEVQNNLGVALQERGLLTEAVGTLRRAVEVKPDFAEAYCNLGGALHAAGELDEAVAAFQHAVALAPHFAEAHNNLGIALSAQGQLEAAIAAFRRALAIDSDDATAYNNLGLALQTQNKLIEAVQAYRRALALAPDDPEVHNNLGGALQQQGELGAAADAYHRALALAPDFSKAHNNLGAVLLAQGKYEEASSAFERALALQPDYAAAHSNLILSLHYGPAGDPGILFAAARKWNACHAESLSGWAAEYPNSRIPTRRLRIGYISADFCHHPVGFFVTPVITAHDKQQVEVVCYADVACPDELTEECRHHADRWQDIVGIDDERLAGMVRADQIDVLIDLAGHSSGNRLLTFARKPAPIQMTGGGHFDTTGLDAIDYLLSDQFHTPPGAERFFSEELIRLPHDYVCYAPPPYAPAVNALPVRRQDRITFGCFNNLAKLTPQVVALWARILTALPQARLRLQTNGLNDPVTRERYQHLFACEGVSAERLVLVGSVPHAQLLAAYGEMDIALDPFPYSGGLTTCEALWMGVPVITLTGERLCGRHSTSHLSNVGLSELVATTAEDYVAVATDLARDVERLEQLRHGLREQMAASPLCDTERYTRALEAVYRRVWQRWCKQET